MTLRDDQIEREEGQLSRGIERYFKETTRKPVADTKAGPSLIFRSLPNMVAAIEAEIAKPLNRRTIAAAYLAELEPVAIAYITARVCINAGANTSKMTKTAMSLSTLIEEHVRFAELDQTEPSLSNAMQRKAKKWTTSFHRRAIMRKAADIASVVGLTWREGEKLNLGVKLIELFIESTGLVVVHQVRAGRVTTKMLKLSDDTSEWIRGVHDNESLLHPFHEPMLVPPMDWRTPIMGGYLTKACRRDFVLQTKTETRDDLFSTDLTSVYSAVNRIQRTPWAINKSVYDVFSALWSEGAQIAGLPAKEDSAPLIAPDELAPRGTSRDDMTEKQLVLYDEFRHAARKIYDANARRQSQYFSVNRKLSMATDLVKHEKFWFPHNVDFRGRIYPLVPDLSPQADDLGKGLLHFAEGKPLGDNGGFWLSVHIANLHGVDKISFDDRVQWVLDNSERIMADAMDPLDGPRFWAEADDPWQALAAHFEWTGFQVEGPAYVSHLSIAMDGSCSGLQHFSAMLKDSVGGRATNLVPAKEPSDIYSMVANKVEEKLGTMSGEPLSMAWLGNVSRKIVKRPCMTFAYSVTSRGIRDQIADEMRKITDGGEYLPGWENFTAATFVAPIVEEAIRDTVDRAARAMDWLKDVTKVLLGEEMPVLWHTPDGFPVVQRYMKSNGKKFKVYFQGERLRLTLRVETTNPDSRKQASAIAPNYVHSMDACHLRMVVNRMHEEGVTDNFAMIHDSFGCHAADVDAMQYIIRDEFIKLYSEDRLVEFYQQALLSLPGEHWELLSLPPEAGDLNLEDVRDADFFFA